MELRTAKPLRRFGGEALNQPAGLERDLFTGLIVPEIPGAAFQDLVRAAIHDARITFKARAPKIVFSRRDHRNPLSLGCAPPRFLSTHFRFTESSPSERQEMIPPAGGHYLLFTSLLKPLDAACDSDFCVIR